MHNRSNTDQLSARSVLESLTSCSNIRVLQRGRSASLWEGAITREWSKNVQPYVVILGLSLMQMMKSHECAHEHAPSFEQVAETSDLQQVCAVKWVWWIWHISTLAKEKLTEESKREEWENILARGGLKDKHHMWRRPQTRKLCQNWTTLSLDVINRINQFYNFRN